MDVARTAARPRVGRGIAWLVALGLAMLLAGEAAAQSAARVPRIGWLTFGSPSSFASRLEAFRQGLRDLGHGDQMIFIEARWGDGRQDRLPGLAAELVRLKVDVIVAVGTPATRAAIGATDSIPIVMVAVGDPVGSGLVPSLARPGGNVTGISNLAGDLSAKMLDLLRDAYPKLGSAILLLNPANPVHPVFKRETQAVATRLGVKLQVVEPRVLDALGAHMKEGADGLVVPPDPVLVAHRRKIVELAARHRLPAIYSLRDYVEAGGLISYGPNTLDLHRRAAGYVDRILKGARPGELPVEQPARFDLVINMKTARALRLLPPAAFLVRADETLE